MSVVMMKRNESASLTPPVPLVPLVPPKDMPEIPATLRLGTNLLGLGLGPLPREQASSESSPVITKSSSTPRSTPPKPSHSVPLCTSTPSPPPPSAPLALHRTLSPASIRSRSDRLPENYAGCSNSSSTTSLAQPSITVTPTKDSPRIQNRMTRNETPSTDWGWRKGSESGDSSRTEARRPHLTSSVSSNSVASVSKKRSSGQLLSGLGRGLGRMGSVMRRNTSDGSSTQTPGGTEAALGTGSSKGTSKTWRKKGKGKEGILPEGDMPWETVSPAPRLRTRREDSAMDDQEGDAGIGRPYNVEHDLHVSPYLDDLPPAWLKRLRKQGLSEQDLLLIASARKRQASVENIPIQSLAKPVEDSRRRSGSSQRQVVDGSRPSLGTGSQRFQDVKGVANHTTGVSSTAPSKSGRGVVIVSAEEQFPDATQRQLIDTASKRELAPVLGEEKDPRTALVAGNNRLHDEEQQEPPGVSPHRRVARVGSEDNDQPAEMVDFGGGRRRTLKKNRRLSDQLRCFSQFDLGGDEGWATGLLDAMNADQVGAVGEQKVFPSDSNSISASPSGDDEALSEGSQTFQCAKPSTIIAVREHDVAPPKPPQIAKTIKRIPIPALLPPAAPREPIDLTKALTSRPRDATGSSSPRPPRQHELSMSAPSTPILTREIESCTPVRQSTDSFGVHYSQSKSSVDLDLITPSSSNMHEHTRRSPLSSEEGGEVGTGEMEEGSILDFGKALQEGHDEYTRSSITDHLVDDYLSGPLRDGLSPLHAGRQLPRSPPNPPFHSEAAMSRRDLIYSVPASITSSLPSRSSTPEVQYLSAATASPLISATTPTGPYQPKDDRTSMALSILSSDSGHGHEATVQMAYTKMVGRLRVANHNAEGRRSSGGGGDGDAGIVGVGRIKEESDIGETESEGGYSAIFALDDAARRVAGLKKQGSGGR